MYTFYPLPDETNIHVGWYFSLVVYLILLFFILKDALEDRVRGEHVAGFVVCSIFLFIIHTVSYHGKKPENIPVTANFVGFQPEYSRVQNGKHYTDRHSMYVIYEVNGQQIILPANEGLTYPKQAILYKN